MTKKDFMLWLSENEIECDLTQRTVKAPEHTEEEYQEPDESEDIGMSGL